MLSLKHLVAVAVALVGVDAIPQGPSSYHELLDRQSGTFVSSYWSDNKGEKVTYKNLKGGEYSVTWSGSDGNFVVGKGYSSGGEREIPYSGTFKPEGNAYLSVYGWTTNPLVEFYIVEAYGTHRPSNTSEAEIKGNMTSDGGSYEIFTKMRVNKPSIVGTATFRQIFSVRWGNRVGGVITTGNHFAAWKKVGLELGSAKGQNMLVATEGQGSNGSATITVGVAPPTSVPASDARR